MSDDFVARLQVQLRDAAEREARRGPLSRATAATRINAPRPLLAVAALVAFVLGIALAAGNLSRETPPAGEPGPRLVKVVDLTHGGGSIATGFGATWVSDPGGGQVLRVAADSGRVLARIPAGVQPDPLVAGAGAVWTYDPGSGRLLRIDPATDRVTARRSLGFPAGSGPASLAILDGHLWAGNAARALQLDSDGRPAGRRMAVSGPSLRAGWLAADAGHVYALSRDGRLATFDGRTGARTSVVSLHVPARALAAAGGPVIVVLDHGFAAVDPATGRTLWQRRIPARRFDAALLDGATLWVDGIRSSGPAALWRIDARTGRVTGTLTLPEYDATGLAMVGGRLWVLAPGGRLQIVSPG